MDSFVLVYCLSLTIITFIFCYLVFTEKQSATFINRYFRLIISVIFLFHLITAFFLKGEIADVRLFATAGYALAHKIDIYWLDPQGGTYSFFPFLIFPYALFWYISDNYPVFTFSFLVKLIIIPAVFLTGLIINAILKREGVSRQRRQLTQLLLVTNPIVFLAATIHGQADILLILFFLLSVYYWQYKRKIVVPGIFMALSIMTKTWSVIFLPVYYLFIKKISNKILFLALLLGSILFVGFTYKLFIFTSWQRILRALIVHPSGSAGFWGITAIFQLLNVPLVSYYSEYRTYILLLAMLTGISIIFRIRIKLLESCLLLVLIFYSVTAGWGLQYTAWIIPFGLAINAHQRTEIYTILAVPYLILSYWLIVSGWEGQSWQNTAIALGLLPWFYSLYWLSADIRENFRS